MQPHTAPPGEAWGLGPGPFLLSGTPPRVSGEIELVNRSSERVKVRAIPARAAASAVKRGGAAAPELGPVRMAARLEPGSRERVFAHLDLAPDTPPGTYEAELDAGGERTRVVVHVFEKQAVVVKPALVRLRGAPGEVLSHVLVVANHGNVPHTLPSAALVHLEERDWFGRSLVYALRETREQEGHQAYLDRVVREMKASDIPPMRVDVSTGGGPAAAGRELRPGGTLEVRLDLTLPEKLIKGRTYIRTIPFMGTQLTFQVECNGSLQSTRRRPR